MATRGEDLAARFEQANAQFVTTIDSLSDEQWKQACAGEQWPVAITAHHVAEDHGILAGLINTIASGGQLPPIDADGLNAMNADHARRATGVARAETVALARSEGEKAAAMLRGLSDDQLAKTGVLPAVGGEVSAAALAENLLIGHIGMHLPSIKEAAK